MDNPPTTQTYGRSEMNANVPYATPRPQSHHIALINRKARPLKDILARQIRACTRNALDDEDGRPLIHGHGGRVGERAGLGAQRCAFLIV